MTIDKEKLLQAFPPGSMRVNGFDVGTVVRELLDAAPNPPQPIYDEAAELNRLFGAATEMLRIAGIANQGSNAYNRAIVNLHEAVTACAQSRAKAVEVGDE